MNSPGTSRPSDGDSEARLSVLLDRIDEIEHSGVIDSRVDELDAELEELTPDQLEELVESKYCLGLLDEWTKSGKALGQTGLVENFDGQDKSGESIGQIGNYLLRRQIGAGGFAHVYVAFDTRLERDVAIKVLDKRFSDDIDVIRRFEREGHAAATLAHPSIVPIFEAGRVEETTFIAMQLCGGGDLKSYLDSLPDRICVQEAVSCIAAISDAMALAHSKSIVHRDLKPANILLAQTPSAEEPIATQLRVSDFGLVKETRFDPDLTSDASHESAIGTPAYMSPEQTRGDAVTPASDVFSIGVMLYELLTGINPHRQDSRSKTFSAIQTDRPTPPSRHRRGLDKNLDAIVLKCIEKSVSDRYPDAMALAEDLQSWRQGRPVKARRSSNYEACVRWCRRNPRTATSSFLVASSLVLAFGFATWKWRAERHHRRQVEHFNVEMQRSQAAAAESARQTESLVRTMLSSIAGMDPSRGGDARMDATQMIRFTADQIEREFPKHDPLRFRMLCSIANAAFGLGRYEEAADYWERAHTTATAIWGDQELEAVRCLAKQADALECSGEDLAALHLRQKVLTNYKDRFGDNSPELLQALTDAEVLQFELGQSAILNASDGFDVSAAAIELCQKQVALLEEQFGPKHETLLAPLQRLARLYLLLGDRKKAAEQMRIAKDIADSTYGDGDPRTWQVNVTTAMIIRRRNAATGLELIEHTRELALQRYDVHHPMMLRIDLAKSVCLFNAGQHAEAIEWLTETQSRAIDRYGYQLPESISITLQLASQLRATGRAGEAIMVVQSALDSLGDQVGQRHRSRLSLEHELGIACRIAGRLDEAIDLLERQAKRAMQEFRPGHPLRQLRFLSLSRALMDDDQFLRASEWLQTWLEEADPNADQSQGRFRSVYCSLAYCFIRQERHDEAASLIDMMRLLNASRGPTAWIIEGLNGCSLVRSGQPVEGTRVLENAYRRLRRSRENLLPHELALRILLAKELLDQYEQTNQTDRAADLRTEIDRLCSSPPSETERESDSDPSREGVSFFRGNG
ncbi:MAG: serine/threonine-protein kinase [Planctomycetota bacterium]